MNSITIHAYAKINLTFAITGVLPNGYHLVETVMQRVSLADTITITPAKAFSLQCGGDIPMEKNLAYKAAHLFFSLYKEEIPVCIDIQKVIPQGAGLGGGSADAAAVLVGLNTLLNTPFSTGELEANAKVLGADVPFLVASSTALCTGIGEILTPIEPPLSRGAFLIVKPVASKSTANVYGAYDALSTKPPQPDSKALIRALTKQDLSSIGKELGNVFEPMMAEKHPEILRIKNQLNTAGALGSAMTGSGTAVYGIFPSVSDAQTAASAFADTDDEYFVASPV